MSKKIIALIVPVIFFLPLTHAKSIKSCSKAGASCEKSALDVGVTALYLQSYTGYFFGSSVITSDSFELESGSGNTPWDWGGALDVRYHFFDKNDVSVSWMHYSTNYGATTNNYGSLYRVSGTLKLNSVNADFAQTFTPSPETTARFFVGAQYLNVNSRPSSSLTVTSSDNPSANSFFNEFDKDKHEGLGPRMGLDANYKLKGNFSVFANSAATILLARQTLSASGYSRQKYYQHNLHADVAVPELEAKLGLTYNKSFGNGTASISAGWFVINYFSLLEGNNLTLSGPFVQGRWVG